MQTQADKRRATGLLVVNVSPPSPLELWTLRAQARQDMGRRS